MDALVTKIIDAARKEAPTAHDCQQALIRAGLIAQAYVGADSEVMGQVFGLSSEFVLQDNVNHDPSRAADRSH
jgi:hypothetical protein